MYSDISGYKAESINKFYIGLSAVTAVAAITVGILMIANPASATIIGIMLLTGGVSVLGQSATIGLAQYHKSKADGDNAQEIYDDVINALGDGSNSSIQRVSGIKGAMHLAKNVGMSAGSIATQFFRGYRAIATSTVVRGQWISGGQSMTSPIWGKIGNTLGIIGSGYAIAMAVNDVRIAIQSFSDEDLAYDKATSYGWNPQ
jgi:hypothetical protein